MTRHHKGERHQVLLEEINRNPFFTDDELAKSLGVSVSTIRLDRAKLGIPELRERTRAVAHEAYDSLISLGQQEVVGELTELRVGEFGSSILKIEETMVLNRARIARGHHLFAQANSLAVALVDAEVAVTGSVQLRYVRPVRQGEKVRIEGQVVSRKGNQYGVRIIGFVAQEKVLEGTWLLFAVPIELKL